MIRILIGAMGLVLLAVAVGADKPAATLPTQKSIALSFKSKDYAGTLQQISRVLPLKGKAAADYDRHELLMLKGESHLQLKQFKSAGDAFAAAAKETEDPLKAATARAMQQVLKYAKGSQIQRRIPRKGEKLQTADLLDIKQRNGAFQIVFDDRRAESDPKVEAARKSRSLDEISKAIESASELRDLELAATGSDADRAEKRRELTDRAKSLINKQLEHANNDVLEIRERANAVVQEKILFNTGRASDEIDGASRRITMRGLSNKDRADLQEAIVTCQNMVKTAKSLAEATHSEPAEVDEVTDRARETVRLAERVLNAKY